MALAVLAAQSAGIYLGAADIASRIGAPANYLGKLLQTLARAGLVESRKGLGGGFRLARPAERISLRDVVDPIEPLERLEHCLLGRATCGLASPCAVHIRYGAMRQQYFQLMEETTIADLVRSGEVQVRTA
jgi:Rrf2 family protein